MTEGKVAGGSWDGNRHLFEQVTIGIEGDFVRRPVKPVFVISLIGVEGQLVHVKRGRVGSVEARFLRLGRLENKIDGCA